MSNLHPMQQPFVVAMNYLVHEALCRSRVALREALAGAADAEHYAELDNVLGRLEENFRGLPQHFSESLQSTPALPDSKSIDSALQPLAALCRRLQGETDAEVARIRAMPVQPLWVAPLDLLGPLSSLISELEAGPRAAFVLIRVLDGLLTERLPWIYAELFASRQQSEPTIGTAQVVSSQPDQEEQGATPVTPTPDGQADRRESLSADPSSAAIAARAINRLIVKHRVPAFVDRFLTQHWVPVLAANIDSFGTDAEVVQHRRDTCRAICWCVSPDRVAADQPKIDALIPKLEIRLRRSLGAPASGTDPVDLFLTELTQFVAVPPDAGADQGSFTVAPPVDEAEEMVASAAPPRAAGEGSEAAAGGLELYEGLSVHDIELKVSEDSVEGARSAAGEAVNLETLFTSTLTGLSIDREAIGEIMGRAGAAPSRGDDDPAGDASSGEAASPPLPPLVDRDETSALFRVVQKEGAVSGSTPSNAPSPSPDEES